MKPSAHLHLIINASIVDPPTADQCDFVTKFMEDMVKHVRMRMMIKPSTAWCDDHGNEGITSVCVLSTSHCALHIWNFPPTEASLLQFDLYSCKEFSTQEVIQQIKKSFNVVEIGYKFLDRETKMIRELESTIMSRITVYSKPNCPYCTKAKTALKVLNLNYTERQIGRDLTRDDVAGKFPTMRSVPIIEIDGKLIGGYEQLMKWLENR